jgi:hypothetical protein
VLHKGGAGKPLTESGQGDPDLVSTNVFLADPFTSLPLAPYPSYLRGVDPAMMNP